jgi:hypothetical protein
MYDLMMWNSATHHSSLTIHQTAHQFPIPNSQFLMYDLVISDFSPLTTHNSPNGPQIPVPSPNHSPTINSNPQSVKQLLIAQNEYHTLTH